MALPEGEFSLEVHVKPDCYVGMDETFKLNIKVSPPTEKVIDILINNITH